MGCPSKHSCIAQRRRVTRPPALAVSDNNRDAYKPKHPTSPAGARRPDPFAGTPTVDATAAAQALARRERERERAPDDFETVSGVTSDPALMLIRTYDRAKSASVSADGVRLEMALMRTSNEGLHTLVMSLARDVATLNGAVQTLTSETQAQRTERVDRDRRAETRAEEADKREADRELRELEARRARTRQILGIWVPTITALGALIVGVIAALRAPEIKYVPMTPNTPTIESTGTP